MKDNLHHRWHEVRTMLTDWLAWLDETQHWVETTAAAESTSESTASSQPSASASESNASSLAISRADLSTLFEAMTALRQEVNLQTRSARRDREQASETLASLSAFVDQLNRRSEEDNTASAVDTVHVDVLLELHDALWRAERQASQVIAAAVGTLHDWCERRGVESSPDDDREASLVEVNTPVATVKPRAFGRWREWFGGSATPAVEPPVASHEPTDDDALSERMQAWVEIGAESGRMASRLEGLMTGYRLSLQRLERIMSSGGIEPIACLGQAVDPALMEVVQIVSDSTKPPGMVADIVRCGYWRYGQVYRFAQVVATRSDATRSHSPTEHPTDS
jgi:molecular chaperone GrpE